MNILVTGATGFIGSHLVTKLAANPGYKVYAAARTSAATPGLKRENVVPVQCDILHSDNVREAAAGADVVVHLAAVKEHYKSQETIISTNVQGTKNLLEHSRHVKQFIFSSSTLAVNPLDVYSESKKQCETLIEQSGVNYTILRVGPVFGSGDTTNLTRLIGLVRDGRAIPIPGDGKQLIQPTHVDDVVKAMTSLIANSEFFNRTAVVAGRPITLKDFIDLVSRTTGKEAKSVRIPVGLLKPLVRVYQSVSDAPKITVEQLDNLGKVESSEVFESDFPISPLEDSIRKTVK